MGARWLTGVPALPLAAGIAAGIMLSAQYPHWWVAMATAAAGTVVLAVLRLHTGVALLGVAIGFMSAMLARPGCPPEAWCDGRAHVFSVLCTRQGDGTAEARIDSVLTGRGMTAVAPVAIVVWHPADDAGLTEGCRYRLCGHIKLLRTLADVPYERLPHAGAIARGATAELELTAAAEALDLPQAAAPRLRQRLHRALIAGGADDSAYELFAAILLADRDILSAGRREQFAAAGIAHILALSGFHVGFIALLAAAMLFPLNLFPRLRWLKQLCMVAAIWGFAWLVGFGASVTRAAVMASVMCLGSIMARPVSPWNSLCLAAAIILVLWPAQLTSPGFLLTTGAVASLLAFAPVLNPVDPKRRALHLGVQTMAVPVAAMAGTMAVTVLWFHVLPTYFLVSNVSVALAFPLLMLAGIATLVCGLVGVTLPAVSACANGICHCLDRLTAGIAAWPGAQSEPLFVDPATAVGVLVFLGACAIVLNDPCRRTLAFAAPVACAALIIGVGCAGRRPVREAYAVPVGSTASVVMSEGRQVCAFVTAAPHHAAAARRRLRACLADYVASRGADSVQIVDGDFSFGAYRRRGQFFFAGNRVTAIPVGKEAEQADAGVGVGCLLLTNRCTASPAEVFDRQRPDTLVISSGTSLRRRRAFEAEATRRDIPVVCLDTAVWQP